MYSAAPPIRLRRSDGRAALGALALIALLGLTLLFDRWSRSDMKRIVTAVGLAGLATAAVLGLSGCSPTRLLADLPAEDRKVILKGASEHISKCDRKYWARTGLPGSAGFEIDCTQRTEELGEIVERAVKAAVAAIQAASAATPLPASSK